MPLTHSGEAADRPRTIEVALTFGWSISNYLDTFPPNVATPYFFLSTRVRRGFKVDVMSPRLRSRTRLLDSKAEDEGQ